MHCSASGWPRERVQFINSINNHIMGVHIAYHNERSAWGEWSYFDIPGAPTGIWHGWQWAKNYFTAFKLPKLWSMWRYVWVHRVRGQKKLLCSCSWQALTDRITNYYYGGRRHCWGHRHINWLKYVSNWCVIHTRLDSITQHHRIPVYTQYLATILTKLNRKTKFKTKYTTKTDL